MDIRYTLLLYSKQNYATKYCFSILNQLTHVNTNKLLPLPVLQRQLQLKRKQSR